MILRFISAVLAMTLITNIAYAQDIDVKGKPVISPLDQGQLSPFDGLLLSPQAVATIIAERESYEPRCTLKTQKAVAENQANNDFFISDQKSKCDADTKVLEIKLKSKIEETQVLGEKLNYEIATRPNRATWASIGFGGGVVITLLSALLISRISN